MLKHAQDNIYALQRNQLQVCLAWDHQNEARVNLAASFRNKYEAKSLNKRSLSTITLGYFFGLFYVGMLG